MRLVEAVERAKIVGHIVCLFAVGWHLWHGHDHSAMWWMLGALVYPIEATPKARR
jgi:hypothetical protein